jgi:hypothetical protein
MRRTTAAHPLAHHLKGMRTMMTAPQPQSLSRELDVIHKASLTMNDMFLAEAALISRELLLQLTERKGCALADVKAEDIVQELQRRSPATYASPPALKPPSMSLVA